MKEKIITSRKNSIIKETVSLINSASLRKEKKMFVAEGARLCLDAAKNKTRIFRLFYTETAYKKYKEYIEPVKSLSDEIYIIEEHVEKLLSDTKNGQGVFAVCEIGETENEIKGKILVMEHLQDPSNLGAILRTGEAFSIDTFVLLGKCCDPYSPKATRSSMGAIFRVDIHMFESLDELLKELLQKKFKCYAAVPNSNAMSILDADFSGNSAVFVGNEGNGLTKECISKIENITIPMRGRAESLNVSSAVSVIMWEMVRDYVRG